MECMLQGTLFDLLGEAGLDLMMEVIDKAPALSKISALDVYAIAEAHGGMAMGGGGGGVTGFPAGMEGFAGGQEEALVRCGLRYSKKYSIFGFHSEKQKVTGWLVSPFFHHASRPHDWCLRRYTCTWDPLQGGGVYSS